MKERLHAKKQKELSALMKSIDTSLKLDRNIDLEFKIIHVDYKTRLRFKSTFKINSSDCKDFIKNFSSFLNLWV